MPTRGGRDSPDDRRPRRLLHVNLAKRRAGWPSRFRHHVRLSFGPPEEVVLTGLERLEGIVREARAGASG